MSANEALARLTAQARGTLEPFVRVSRDGGIDFDLTSQQAIDHLHLIKKLRVKRRRTVQAGQEWESEIIEIELHDAQAALIQIGRHHRLFTDRVETNFPTLSIQGLEEALDKAYGSRNTKRQSS